MPISEHTVAYVLFSPASCTKERKWHGRIFSAIKGGIVTTLPKTSESALSSDSVLVTRYAYRPLVGCTAISYPNMRTVSYGYDGGRLSTISNTNGNVVKSYDYAIYAEEPQEGCNLVTEHTYTDVR